MLSRKEGAFPLTEMVKQYLKLAVNTDNYTSNTKYCLAQMLQGGQPMGSQEGHALLAAGSMRDICDIWGMGDYLEEAEGRRSVRVEGLSLQQQKELGVASFCPGASKRQRLDVEVAEDGTMELLVRYNKRELAHPTTPKSTLADYTRYPTP